MKDVIKKCNDKCYEIRGDLMIHKDCKFHRNKVESEVKKLDNILNKDKNNIKFLIKFIEDECNGHDEEGWKRVQEIKKEVSK